MGYAEARRVPPNELYALWEASESRMARKELRLLDDLFAVAGLQSEVRVEGEKPRKSKRATPVTLNERRAELREQGYPTARREAYSPERDREKIMAMFAAGGLEEAITVARPSA